MAENGWRDLVAADRMAVDREFNDRIRESGLSPQQWSLVMTVVEFDIARGDGGPRLVADTERVEAVLPELAKMERGGPPMGGPGGSGGGGLLSSIRSALGLGGGNGERLEEATALAEEYATLLQDRLEEKGKWERVLEAADQPSPE